MKIKNIIKKLSAFYDALITGFTDVLKAIILFFIKPDTILDIIGISGLILLAFGLYEYSPILMKCVLGAILFLLALLPYIIKIPGKNNKR